jgi:hypothetical protein
MYFVLTYENRTLKPVEIALRRGQGKWGEGRMMRKDGGGMNLIETYCKYISKCHNVLPV